MSAPAGRSVELFAAEAGISRATFYKLIPECAPRAVKIGKRLVVMEAPGEWLARMATRGGAKTKRGRSR